LTGVSTAHYLRGGDQFGGHFVDRGDGANVLERSELLAEADDHDI